MSRLPYTCCRRRTGCHPVHVPSCKDRLLGHTRYVHTVYLRSDRSLPQWLDPLRSCCLGILECRCTRYHPHTLCNQLLSGIDNGWWCHGRFHSNMCRHPCMDCHHRKLVGCLCRHTGRLVRNCHPCMDCDRHKALVFRNTGHQSKCLPWCKGRRRRKIGSCSSVGNQLLLHTSRLYMDFDRHTIWCFRDRYHQDMCHFQCTGRCRRIQGSCLCWSRWSFRIYPWYMDFGHHTARPNHKSALPCNPELRRIPVRCHIGHHWACSCICALPYYTHPRCRPPNRSTGCLNRNPVALCILVAYHNAGPRGIMSRQECGCIHLRMRHRCPPCMGFDRRSPDKQNLRRNTRP